MHETRRRHDGKRVTQFKSGPLKKLAVILLQVQARVRAGRGQESHITVRYNPWTNALPAVLRVNLWSPTPQCLKFHSHASPSRASDYTSQPALLLAGHMTMLSQRNGVQVEHNHQATGKHGPNGQDDHSPLFLLLGDHYLHTARGLHLHRDLLQVLLHTCLLLGPGGNQMPCSISLLTPPPLPRNSC